MLRGSAWLTSFGERAPNSSRNQSCGQCSAWPLAWPASFALHAAKDESRDSHQAERKRIGFAVHQKGFAVVRHVAAWAATPTAAARRLVMKWAPKS